MNLSTATAAIRSYFETEWGDECALVFDDQDYTPQANTEFVRLNIRHSMGDQKTMGAPGNNRHQLEGGITVQIFTPQGNSFVRGSELADKAAGILRGKSVSGIVFYQVFPRETGPDGRGFLQTHVNARFRYDQFA